METELNWFELLVDEKFGIIYADLPWKYTGKFKGAACKYYKLMNFDEICKMPVKQLTNKNCALLLWTIGPKLYEALKVCKAWKFKYKTVFTVWNKLYKYTQQLICGVSWYNRSFCEFLLVVIKEKLKNSK
jgi:N6-adenosine-specific RNA methylase IME4